MDAAVVGRPSEHCRARQSYHKPALHDMFVAMYYNVVLYYHLLRAPYGMDIGHPGSLMLLASPEACARINICFAVPLIQS